MSDFSVCIVTHNCEADIAGCLAAVEGLRPLPREVVIVDSGSVDGSVEESRSAGRSLNAVVLALNDNVGFAPAMNLAIGRTTAPWVLSLNADARPASDYASLLLDRFRTATVDRTGAVTGLLERPEGENGQKHLDAAGMRLTLTWRHLDRGSNEIDRGQFSRPEKVFGATGAATLFSRRALDDVAIEGEYFLEEFHSYREDAELAFRFQERDWNVLFEPRARCVHRRANLPERRRQMSALVNYHSLKNRYLLRAYHQTSTSFLMTLGPALGRDIGIALFVALCERSSLGAYLWLWENRRQILRRRRLIKARRTAPSARVDRWFISSSQTL